MIDRNTNVQIIQAVRVLNLYAGIGGNRKQFHYQKATMKVYEKSHEVLSEKTLYKQGNLFDAD